MKVKSFICDICGKHKQNDSDIAAGYGTNSKDQIICYDCCAAQDKADMVKTGKAVLYLTHETEQKGNINCLNQFVSNWPGSLKICVRRTRIGRHNIAGRRYDVWFVFNGHIWHGVTYGDNTQLCHCKQTKTLRK